MVHCRAGPFVILSESPHPERRRSCSRKILRCAQDDQNNRRTPSRECEPAMLHHPISRCSCAMQATAPLSAKLKVTHSAAAICSHSCRTIPCRNDSSDQDPAGSFPLLSPVGMATARRQRFHRSHQAALLPFWLLLVDFFRGEFVLSLFCHL